METTTWSAFVAAHAPAEELQASTQDKAPRAKKKAKSGGALKAHAAGVAKKRPAKSADKATRQEQRMVKNRESAARSRQRRQEHVTELEQVNELLRAQLAVALAQVDALQQSLDALQWQLHGVPGVPPPGDLMGDAAAPEGVRQSLTAAAAAAAPAPHAAAAAITTTTTTTTGPAISSGLAAVPSLSMLLPPLCVLMEAVPGLQAALELVMGEGVGCSLGGSSLALGGGEGYRTGLSGGGRPGGNEHQGSGDSDGEEEVQTPKRARIDAQQAAAAAAPPRARVPSFSLGAGLRLDSASLDALLKEPADLLLLASRRGSSFST